MAYKKWKNIEERFWAKVNKIPNGCWLWTSALDEHGYGEFTVKVDGKWRWVRAHRYCYELVNKTTIPKELFALHKCDTPACVNPEHIFLGTQKDNLMDMASKGRQSHQVNPSLIRRGDDHPLRKNPSLAARGDRHSSKTHPELIARGESHGMTSLKVDDILEIRNNHSNGTLSISELSVKFNVSKSTISNIIHKRTWGHVK